jgi:hypothetical protein
LVQFDLKLNRPIDDVIPNRRKAAVRNLLFEWSNTALAAKVANYELL